MQSDPWNTPWPRSRPAGGSELPGIGLNLGREVEVIQNNRGLIIVGVNGGRVALGRGISQKILAELVVPLLTDQRSG
jgi:hypothetical protein